MDARTLGIYFLLLVITEISNALIIMPREYDDDSSVFESLENPNFPHFLKKWGSLRGFKPLDYYSPHSFYYPGRYDSPETSLENSESRDIIRSYPNADINSFLSNERIVTDGITKSNKLETKSSMPSDSYPSVSNLMSSDASTPTPLKPLSASATSDLYPTSNLMSSTASSDLYTTSNAIFSTASSDLYTTSNPMSSTASSDLYTTSNPMSSTAPSASHPISVNAMSSTTRSASHPTSNPMSLTASSDLYPTTPSPMLSDASSNLYTASNSMSSDLYPTTSNQIEIKTSSIIPNLESSSQGHRMHYSSGPPISDVNTSTTNSPSSSTISKSPNHEQATLPQDHIIKISSIRTARMIVSVIFIVIALVAASGLAVYIFTVRRRGVEYDQLLLLP